MISAIGHAALQVPNVDDSVRWATTVMGLRETAREGNTSYLTHGGQHHSLIYIGAGEGALDHISLEAANEAALDELRDRLPKHGIKTVDHQREPAGQRAVPLSRPDGHQLDGYTGVAQDPHPHPRRGVPP